MEGKGESTYDLNAVLRRCTASKTVKEPKVPEEPLDNQL